ncbi:MAG: hypothetical protein QG650_789 [Patescibacteria group bacterium]|nr:hypothetical protein [Patescibacteria group bacterium]
MFRKGFTLVEIVMAVAISTLLIAGTVGIVTQVAESMTSAKATAKTYSALSEVVSRLKSVRSSYPLATAVSVPDGYDYLVFTNSGKTSGTIVGVANAASGSVDFRLDPVSDYANYGEKAFFVQDVTGTQTNALLTDPSAAYSLPIREESLYRDLVVESLEATPYNSGALMDVSIGLYVVPHPELQGKPKSSMPDFPNVLNIVL